MKLCTLASAVMMIGTLATVSPVSGQTIMGAGMISCGEWLRLRSFVSRGQNFKELASAYQAQAWVDGFISGFNYRDHIGPDLLASRPDGAAMYAWIDNYCRSKPLDFVASAVVGLVKELESRAQ
jgi:hypothetical protein